MMPSLKQWGRRAAAWGYCVSREYGQFLQGKLSILMYHRVLPAEHPDLQWVQPGMYVLQESFERHLRFLKDHCDMVSFAEVLALWEAGRWNARARYCTVTFDDGWLDNYQFAWPLLRQYAVPATIFLPTSWIGAQTWFWPDRLGWLLCAAHREARPSRWQEIIGVLIRAGVCPPGSHGGAKEFADRVIVAAKALTASAIEELIEAIGQCGGVSVPAERRLMNWAEVDELSRAGLVFGSHACTHVLLPQLTAEACARELRDSDREITARGINAVPVFCYPNGSYNETIARQVAEAGYRAAVTTEYGHESARPANPYTLHRIGLHEDVSGDEASFVWRMAGPDWRAARWARGLWA